MSDTKKTEMAGSGLKPSASREDAAARRETLAAAVLACLEQKKAKDVIRIRLDDKSVLADDFFLASGSSVPQVRALAEAVMETLEEKFQLVPTHREGMDSYRWVALDYLDFVVHIFHEEERAFYSLDKLWNYQPGRAASLSPKSSS